MVVMVLLFLILVFVMVSVLLMVNIVMVMVVILILFSSFGMLKDSCVCLVSWLMLMQVSVSFRNNEVSLCSVELLSVVEMVMKVSIISVKFFCGFMVSVILMMLGVRKVSSSVVIRFVMNELMVVVVSVGLSCFLWVILLFLSVVMIEVFLLGVFSRIEVVELLYILL